MIYIIIYTMHMQIYDAAILGAGASGLFCAAGMPAKSKIIIERNPRPGLKILASGGGLCNFSNKNISLKDYLSANPRFAASALAGFKPQDFTALLKQARVPYTVREDGKMFALSSASILNMLLGKINKSNTNFAFDTTVKSVTQNTDYFEIYTDKKTYLAKKVICALGALSYPKLGGGDSAYKIARSFGLEVTPLYPALTPVIFSSEMQALFAPLCGVSCKAQVALGKIKITDDILFTHHGLSGPAIFQLSLYGMAGKEILLNFLPGADLRGIIGGNKTSPKKLSALLGAMLPMRLAQTLTHGFDKQLAALSRQDINNAVKNLQAFAFTPAKVAGYEKAEITAGGVDTRAISSQTMEARAVKGLYFIGEALDISGRLGGYNLHWAWASAQAALKDINI